ncbi:MAG: AAA family ATPase [Bacteroidales bacterium]|jgi:predicted ATPase|nr:AAA family ATPase [Bacteroidales bacterium]
MNTIDSADAKEQLDRIDEILSEKHLLIGGLAVQFFHPARESKDIDLVCSHEVRTKIIDKLYPSDIWEVVDANRDEYRPNYRIKHKLNGLVISFGPKITEREPYKDIKWDLILKEYSIPFIKSKDETFSKIYIPQADALAYTKLISFINRQGDKCEQDLKDFVDLTNNKRCSIDVLYNLIKRIVSDSKKLQDDFWAKICSDNEFDRIIERGNIFKFADFFHRNNPFSINGLPKDSVVEEDVKPIKKGKYSNILFFPQNNRPKEAELPDAITNAKKLSFMARTGINFLGFNANSIVDAIQNNQCKCKFLVFNKYSPGIEYGQVKPDFDVSNVFSAYEHLKNLKNNNNDNVEIRVLNSFPPFSFEYYEKNDEEKIIIIRPHFFTNYTPSDRPMFMLKNDNCWYNIFYNEFDNLWKKSQVWGKTQKWGTPGRIVIDGPPGAGKTTLLVGTSDRAELGNKVFIGSFKESGYTVFGGLINDSIKDMRKEKNNPVMEPSDNWDMFFKYAIERAIKSYNEAKPDLINFYDRGIIFLEVFAELGGYKGEMPPEYHNFIENNRYDTPVFIFHPIPGYKVSPQAGDAKFRNYDFNGLEKIYEKTVAAYKKYNYKVVEIKAPNKNMASKKDKNAVQKNIDSRITIIKKELGI